MNISRSKSQFAMSFFEKETVFVLLFNEVAHDVGSAIGRIIINYQNMKRLFEGKNGIDDSFNVFALFVSGYNYDAVGQSEK